MSVRGHAGIVKVVLQVTETNGDLFPPIEEAGVAKIGVELWDMEMIHYSSKVVPDIVHPRPHESRPARGSVPDWIRGIIFEEAHAKRS